MFADLLNKPHTVCWHPDHEATWTFMIEPGIDTIKALEWANTGETLSASIKAVPEGWSVKIFTGTRTAMLCVQRTQTPRVWRSLDRCVAFLKTELGLLNIGSIDLSGHDQNPEPSRVRRREDAAERLRHAHQAAAYDSWFRQQVESALADADSGSGDWVTDEDAQLDWQATRTRLTKRSGKALTRTSRREQSD